MINKLFFLLEQTVFRLFGTGVIFRAACHYCQKPLVEFRKGKGRVFSHWFQGEETTPHYTFACPHCGQKNIVRWMIEIRPTHGTVTTQAIHYELNGERQ